MKFTLETLVTKKLTENSKFLFLFLPLLFIPIGNEYFENPKYYFLLFFGFFSLFSLNFKDLKFKSLTFISFVFYLLITFISSSQIFFLESFFGTDIARQTSILFLLVLFILILFFSQKKFSNYFIKNVESYFLVGVFISSVLGTIQFLIKPLGLIAQEWYFDGRIVSTLGHPNFLACSIVIGLILLERVKLPWVYLTLILCLLLTLSKTSIILYFIYEFYRYIKKLYFQNRKIAVTLFLTLFCFFLFIIFGLFSNTYKDLIGNKPYMYQFQRFLVFLDPKETSLDLRFKIWSEAFKIISDSPFLGYGKGQIFRLFEIPDLNELTLSSTHNLYLDVALESGLLGLTAFLIFIFSSLMNSYKYHKSFFLIQLFIVLHGLFDITPVILWFFFIFISGISINKFNKNYLKQL